MATSKLAIWVFAATVILLMILFPLTAEKPGVHEGSVAEVTAVYG